MFSVMCGLWVVHVLHLGWACDKDLPVSNLSHFCDSSLQNERKFSCWFRRLSGRMTRNDRLSFARFRFGLDPIDLIWILDPRVLRF